MTITLIVGARPNFMKIAPIVRALQHAQIPCRIIHSGQHYDQRMSQTFFEELNIPMPDVNLAVGSGSHVYQISEVMKRLEVDFEQNRPDAVIAVGDVNSTVAAALTARKMEIPVAHVEAGLRSFDRSMPEETNLILTDSVCDWLFTSEPSGDANLQREGVSPKRIFQVDNVMIDTLFSFLESARTLAAPRNHGLKERQFAVLTLHRPANVDDPHRLESILKAVHELSQNLPVVFPMHPRTKTRLDGFGFTGRPELTGFLAIEPQGYLSMLGLIDSARLVLTDSGGLQEETTALRVPCLTLRENTECPVTIDIGSNRLVGWRTEHITAAVGEVLAGPERIGQIPEKWDGLASERIVSVLCSELESIDRPETVTVAS